jgi:hypothetical protein
LLLGLLVGRWWTVLLPILLGAFAWLVWSGDREVDAVAAGFLFGVPATVGTVIGLLVRTAADSESARGRSPAQWARWARLIIGVDPKDPPHPPKVSEDPQAHREERPS